MRKIELRMNEQIKYETIKELVYNGGTVKDFKFSTPKMKSSIRTLPLNKVLLNDLQMLKEINSKKRGFNNKYFVIGDVFPISSNTIANRKNKNCKLANVPQIRIHNFRHSCAS